MAGKEFQMAFSIGARLQSQFGSTFKSAQASVVTLQSKIESLNKKQGDINAYQRQQAAVEKTRSKLEMLQKQYENIKQAMGQNGEASVALKNQELQKQLQIEKTSQALSDNEKKLQTMGNALSEAGIDTNNLASESQKLSSQLETLKGDQEQAAQASEEMGQSMADSANAMAELVAAAGAMKVLQVGYDAMKQCVEASVEFETSMAAVKRTVGGSDAFLTNLGNEFKNLSTEIPITTKDLTQIATTAGQLGIAQEKVQSFTTVMAELATTTDLSADSAATMLAQFANITGLTDYERLGSVVAELGDATATTASKVVEMSQGMAASASQAGMTSTDIMAIAAAVGSLGIESASGATSMSTLISSLYKAVETGDGLAEFASVANMSADQFKQAWGVNAVGALDSFIQGLNDTERNGKSAIVILDELGINNVRQTKAILGLSSAGSLLSNTIAQANNAWNSNTALAAKAAVMYNTTEAKLTMLSNAANNTKIAVGDALTPALGGLADAGTAMLRPIAAFIQSNPVLIRAITAAAAVLAVATLGVTGYAAAVRVATKVQALFTATIPGLNVIMAVTVAIAALTAGIILLSEAFRDGQESMEDLDAEFDSLNDNFKKQSHIRSLCAEYESLQKELIDTKGAAQQLTGLDDDTVTIKVTAQIAEGFTKLDADDFVDASYVYLSAKQANTLAQLDFIPEGTLISLSAKAANALAAEGFLDGQEVWLTAQALNELEAAGFLDKTTVGLTATTGNSIAPTSFVEGDTVKLTAEMANALQAAGYFDTTTVGITATPGNELQGENFLGTDVVKLIPEKGGNLSADGFLDSKEVSLTAKHGNTLQAEEYLADDSVSIDATPGNSLSTDSFMTGKEVKLTAEMANFLNAQEYMKTSTVSIDATTGNSLTTGDFVTDTKVKLTAEMANHLAAQGFLENSSVQLTPEIAKFLEAKGFLKGSEVELSATAAKELAATDFLIGSEVNLTPNAINKLIAGDFLKGTDTITIVGVPNGTITVDDYISTQDRIVELTANVSNLAEVQSAISSLKAEAETLGTKTASAKADLTSAQTALSDMEKRQQELQARLTHAGSESAKSEIQSAIEAQSAAIEAQRGKVEELEAAYASSATQYALTQAAADELAAKEQRLSEVKAALADETDGVVSAIERETEAINAQVAQADKLAAAEQAKLRSQIYENVTKQAKQYSDAVRESGEITAESAGVYDTWNRTLKYAGMSAEEVTEAYQGLLRAFDEKAAAPDFVPFSDEAMDAVAEIQALAYLMGTAFSDLQQYADGSVSLSDAFGWLETNNSTILYETEFLNDRVGQYGDAMKELQAIQNLFIQNLSEGVKSGALTAEEAYGLLSTSLRSVGADTETVRAAVEQLNAELGETPEEVAQATASAAEVNAAIQPVLDQMTKLSESYTEAYDAAYKSMDGQFKLFEEAPALTEQSVDKMIAALESQAAYMQQYSANLKAAAEMGLSDGLIAQLSDGSVESAAYLAAIVSDGATKIDELNTAFAGVEEGKQDFANTVAEMQTDFAEKMAALQSDLDTLVAEMDMSGEAADAGAATVQAFADGAKGKISAVSAAFAAVADAAAVAFKLKIPGHAAGTDSAEQGFAMVGERGPELVYFRGGEQVLNAQETQTFMRNSAAVEPVHTLSDHHESGNYHIEIKPEFNITGTGSSAEMESIMQKQTDRMREMVEEVLSDIESDHVRSVYTK